MTGSHVTRIDEETASVLSPVGDFDISSVEILRGAILDGLDISNSIVLDLRQTTFVDSMALGAIINGARRARESGGWLRLVAPQPNVRKALSVTNLDQVIGLYDTVEQAVAHAHTDTGEGTGPA